MTSALGPGVGVAALGAELCACMGTEQNAAIRTSDSFGVAQRFNAAIMAFSSRWASAPEVLNTSFSANCLVPAVARPLIILPPPPAPAGSTEFASDPARARWNQTTPAKCAPRRPIRHHQWLSLPDPATAEYSRPSRPAELVPRYSVAHPRPA